MPGAGMGGRARATRRIDPFTTAGAAVGRRRRLAARRRRLAAAAAAARARAELSEDRGPCGQPEVTNGRSVWGGPASPSIRERAVTSRGLGREQYGKGRKESAWTCSAGSIWAEDHHDIALVDTGGQLLARRRVSDDAAGLALLLGLLTEHGEQALMDLVSGGDRYSAGC